jgi:peptidoglycan/xylan/chitin deacetylase (PgdA/CDA1 family)
LSALPNVRDTAKTLLAVVLCTIARFTAERAGIALVYHRVGGEGGDSRREILAAVSDESFRRQLRHLARHYRIVRGSELVEAVQARRRGQRFPAAITFDDDLAGHVRDALPALQEAGLSATFFLGGTSLGSPHRFWWDDLQRAVDGKLVEANAVPHVPETDVRAALERSPKAIFRVAATIEQLERPQRAETAAALRAAAGQPSDNERLRAEDIRTLLAGGAEIGFHTRRHDLLTLLSDDELREALREGRDELAAVTGTSLETISYPHGQADERVARSAREAGFVSGFVTARRRVDADTDPLLIPRIPPAMSPGKTALRLARALTQ